MASEEELVAPKDEDSLVWRYMDFTKFVAMLEGRALYFARADCLGDPFEGSYSRANERLRPEVYKGKIPDDKLKEISIIFSWMPKWTYINCWHLNERESAAMWKLYTRTDESIAIRSTFATLRKCLPGNVRVGLVRYIDYETEWVPEGNSLYPFLHKRKSFEHEREVRAIWQELKGVDGKITVSAPPSDLGHEVPTDLTQLIRRILVAPNSPTWFERLVAGVTKRYGLDVAVSRSRLEDAPFF